jgi:predicted RNase H-like nuclease
MTGDVTGGAGGRWVAGVDGCPGGWIAVLVDDGGCNAPRVELRTAFADIVDLPEQPLVIGVDMPIGLPDRLVGRGRACEVAVRKRLGARQSSVFSIPARAAVMESDDYWRACDIAAADSEPPRKVSKQAFHLFPKIKEIDALLRQRAELRGRVHETHPEVCFMHMNGGAPAFLPKKAKSRPNPEGLEERRGLLIAAGFPAAFLEAHRKPPRPAAADDFLDACATAWTARRILNGQATCYPDPPPRDAFGLEMAIRA